MVHPGRPPLSPSKPYCRPLNYPEYVKEFNPDAHVRVFKVAIRTNSEINDVEIVNLFRVLLPTWNIVSIFVAQKVSNKYTTHCFNL